MQDCMEIKLMKAFNKLKHAVRSLYKPVYTKYTFFSHEQVTESNDCNHDTQKASTTLFTNSDFSLWIGAVYTNTFDYLTS